MSIPCSKTQCDLMAEKDAPQAFLIVSSQCWAGLFGFYVEKCRVIEMETLTLVFAMSTKPPSSPGWTFWAALPQKSHEPGAFSWAVGAPAPGSCSQSGRVGPGMLVFHIPGEGPMHQAIGFSRVEQASLWLKIFLQGFVPVQHGEKNLQSQ